jgi:hypothetical protein
VRIAAALVLLCLLCGCSTMRLAYDNADIYLRWRAGTYLDVHGEAAEELDRRIASFVGWHRAQALPQYAATAEEAAQRLSRGLSPEDLVWGYDSLLVQAREGLHAAAERVAPLLDRLDAGQLAHLEQRIAEDNRRFARENLQGSEHERRRRRAQRIVERLEDWVGELSQAQLERVRQYSDRAPLTGEARDRDRRRLQAEVLALVRARRARSGLAQRVAHWQHGRDPAVAERFEASRSELFSMLLDLDRMLEPEQRARAVASLRRYAADFRLLARRAP